MNCKLPADHGRITPERLKEKSVSVFYVFIEFIGIYLAMFMLVIGSPLLVAYLIYLGMS